MSQFNFGNVSATNLQMGDHNTQNIAMSDADRSQIQSLLSSLHQQIQQAPIPEEARQQITQQVLPEMQQAMKQPDPKPGLAQGLEHLNANLEKASTTASSVSAIVGTVAKIAGIIGVGVKAAAPFLASFL